MKKLCLGLIVMLAFLPVLETTPAGAGLHAPDLLIISPDWYVTGSEPGAEYAFTTAPAGDINRDGYDDVLVGSPKYDADIYSGGMAALYLGSPQGLSYAPAWSYGLADKGARFGAAAAPAGDVNADGYPDVVIGAYRCNQGQSEEGCAYLFLGGPGGLGAAPAWTFESDLAGAQLGYAVAGAGDVNGDGFDDVLVGARWYAFGESNEGAAYLFLGSPAGLSEFPQWFHESDRAGAAFGTAVAGAGDLNGDGYADLAIGAPHAALDTEDEGVVYVFYGAPAGPAAAPDWTAAGGQTGSLFGEVVETAGDVNADGAADLFVGAPQYAPETGGGIPMGAAFVFFGSAGSLPAAPGWMVEGAQGAAAFGCAGGAAGDVNHDGWADLLIGAYLLDDDQPDEGAIYVYFGGPNGLAVNPDWIAFGDKAETWFGFDAHGAGDVNGDGYADLIAGAPSYRFATSILGRAMVFHGRPVPVNEALKIYLPLVRIDQ